MPQTRDFNRIKKWMDPKLKANGWSYEKFARLVGVSRAAIYQFATDKNRPAEETMVSMCQVLGVPLQEGFAQYTPRRVNRSRRS